MSDQFELVAESAVLRLTEPWVDVVITGTGKSKGYARIDHPALLDMLAAAKRSSLESGGASSGGGLAERAPANVAALVTWNHIDTATRRSIRTLSKGRIEPDLKAAMLQLHGMARAAHASGGIAAHDYLRVMRDFPRWASRIWEMFDPPRVKNLNGPCPQCEAVIYVNAEKASTSALIAYYWKGLEAEARCQVCGVTWRGVKELLNLGYSIKANVDEDTLREMGAL